MARDTKKRVDMVNGTLPRTAAIALGCFISKWAEIGMDIESWRSDN